MKTYGVIMAGGGGTRFWPLSRKALPKQFLNLSGKDIMVNETIDRQKGIIAKEDIFIVTNARHSAYTFEAAGGRIRKDHILAEPAARNTAACIGYAAMEITKKYGDGIMCIFAADHHIRDEAAYTKVMQKAIQTVEETDALVTIGIKPTFPSTGYGYINYEEQQGKVYRTVKEFVEKPDRETAEAYIATGAYAWNSGMFVWKASTILGYFERLLPDIYACLKKIGDAMGTEREAETIAKVYPVIPKISIDYGIMERADHVLMLEGDFGWSDVGSWDTLEAICQKDTVGNVCSGKHLALDTKNCVLYATDKLIAAIGLEDVVVVQAKDAVLVCKTDQVQRIREVVEQLETEGMEAYL